jgi:hypothetical protein
MFELSSIFLQLVILQVVLIQINSLPVEGRHLKGAFMRTVFRPGDMDPYRGIKLELQRDGDVIITIEQGKGPINNPEDSEEVARVEFCLSGGRSHNTLAALRALFKAIEKDNEENPIPVLRKP